MKCRDIRHKLSAYLDNEIDGAEKKAIMDHISSCPSCSRQFQKMKSTIATLQQFPHAAVSPDFESRLQKKLYDKSFPLQKRKFKSIILLPAAACFLIIFIFSITMFSKRENIYYLSLETSNISLSREKREKQDPSALLFAKVITTLNENNITIKQIDEIEGVNKKIHIILLGSDYQKLLESIRKLGNIIEPEISSIPENKKIVIIIEIQ